MGQAILTGDPDITVTLRRSGRARNMSLRVSRLDGRVTLSLPDHVSTREAMRFLREKESWIRKHRADFGDEMRPVIGGHVPFEGREWPIVAGRGRSARIEDGAIVVPGDADRAPARVGALFKALARDRLDTASRLHADRLGVRFAELSLRDTRSRWGSCSAQGRLMYSWRLVMAPPAVLDYVAAHEVAHLREMNHSAAFWAQVARTCPDYARHRKWLREHGTALHRWRFSD